MNRRGQPSFMTAGRTRFHSRTVPQAHIIATSNDSNFKSHTRIAQLAIERAKRLVEAGKDVFVLMDSLTRIGRAFNNAMSDSGRTMSDGMDPRAIENLWKLFAAARSPVSAESKAGTDPQPLSRDPGNTQDPAGHP
jgi:transcription termination factor Rho